MNSREIVTRAIKFRTPERLADDENDHDLGTPPEKKSTALRAFLDLDPWKTTNKDR